MAVKTDLQQVAISASVPPPGAKRLTSSQRSLRAGLVLLGLLVAAAILAPALSPYAANMQDLKMGLAPVGSEHWLGCDKLGRDVLSRLLYGARVSLFVGFVSTLISLTFGTFIGALSGYRGGRLDFWLMRLVDVFLAFPGLLLAIAMASVLGPGTGNVILALSLGGWTGYARLVRGEVLSLATRDHVEAARALGLGHGAILLRHILPLLVAPLVVQASFGIAGAVVAEAGLGFLGLGVSPQTPSWGSMLADGRSFMTLAPRLVIIPGLAISSTVLLLNAVGESLRRVLDVREEAS